MPRIRRSQAERRAVSTARITDATVRSLFRRGYGATSISVVIEEAGISRGALLHHFPSKTDLMLAVVQHAWAVDRRYYRAWFAAQTDPRTRLLRLVEPVWKALSRPTGVAVLEILIACRSDAGLAAVVVPAQLRIQDAARKLLHEEVTGPAGVELARSDDFQRFMEATLRGLAIDLMITRNPSSIDCTLEQVRAAAGALLD